MRFYKVTYEVNEDGEYVYPIDMEGIDDTYYDGSSKTVYMSHSDKLEGVTEIKESEFNKVKKEARTGVLTKPEPGPTEQEKRINELENALMAMMDDKKK